jgi:hypothetical protein
MEQQTLVPVAIDSTGRPENVADQYLHFCHEHLGELDEYVHRQDIDAVSRVAHALRGNAGRFGLRELSSLGRQLEEYCLGGDWRAIGSACAAISQTVSRLCSGTPRPIPVQFAPDSPERECTVCLADAD